jgi:hypothetical protein
MKFKAFSLALAAAALTAPFAASAVPLFPVFTVQPGAGLQGTMAPYQANDIGGQYRETFTFGAGNTFTSSLLFMGNIISFDDTVTPKTYLPAESGLGSRYQLYVLETTAGTFSTSGATTTFQVTSGNLQLYLDPFANSGQVTLFPGNAPNGTTPYARTNFADDILLGSGTLMPAGSSGTQNCTGGNNCGSFGQTASFALTAAGSSFFITPVPFYNLSLTSGQFEGVNPVIGTNAFSTGTANAVFANAMPEPSVLALAGIALVALGCSRRRRDQA